MGMWRLKSAAGYVLLAALTIVALALLTRSAPSASAHHLCPNTGSTSGPFDIQTYEAADYRNLYARTFELAGGNKLFPDISSFALPRTEIGERPVGSAQTVSPTIPPVLLKAMAYLESGWAQASFSPLVDYGETGPVLSSHDCGYGIMQVTTGMQNISGVPSLDQAMIGSHYAFNIARGAKILVDKWNQAPEFRPVIGNRAPAIIENWYYAIWAYNGWAFQNHPLNPAFSTTRGQYSCGPANDGLGHDRSQYPYQEIVLGCVANPPTRLGAQLWAPQPVHMPELTDPKYAEPMKVENWNPCTYSGQCAAMDIPTPNTSHTDPTATTLTRDQVIGAPAMTVSGSSLNLTLQPSATTLNTSFTVVNSGSGVLGYRASSTASWLKVSPSAGVALGSDLDAKEGTVQLAIDAATLAPGTHTAEVRVESLYPAGTLQTVRVTIETALRDGTVARGSGATIYLISGGLRRAIPNPATFEALGLRWDAIQVVPNSRLALHGLGNPVLDVTTTGILIKGPAPDVYVMDRGAKRHAVNVDRFLGCNYKWDAIMTLPGSVVDSIANGAPLALGDCPVLNLPDGTLLEGPTPGIWVMEGGLRRWAVSVDMFLSCGHEWGDVNKVSPGLIASIPQGNPLSGCYTEGTLLRGSSPDIYVVDSGLKRKVPNMANFTARGLLLSAVQDISDGFLNTMPTGRPLLDLFADGAFVKGSSQDVYVMEGGTKRHAVSAQRFLDCGYGFDAVVTVPESVLQALPAGAPLNAGDCPRPSFADGTLLEGSIPGIWVVQGGQRRWAVSAEIFISCGHLWGNVNVVADSTIAFLPQGTPLTRC